MINTRDLLRCKLSRQSWQFYTWRF